LGKTVNLDNQIVEVVGVAPHGFKGTSLYQPDFWLPASMEQFFGTYPIFYLVGRLRDAVSPKQAADMLAPVVQDTTKNLLAAGDPIYTNSISQFSRVTLLREGYGSLPAGWAWEGRKDLTKASTLVGVAPCWYCLLRQSILPICSWLVLCNGARKWLRALPWGRLAGPWFGNS
jgi:hypothetical protein